MSSVALLALVPDSAFAYPPAVGILGKAKNCLRLPDPTESELSPDF
jgi:hypothetical protein